MEAVTKADALVREPAVPRGRSRRIALRTAKYSLLLFLAIVMCLTIVTWWRSYSHIDQLHGVFWNDDHRLLVTSIEGRFVATEYQQDLLQRFVPGNIGNWVLCTNSVTLIHGMYPPQNNVFQTRRVGHRNHAGWLVVNEIAEFELPPLHSMKLLWTDARPNMQLAYYHGLIVPHWIILLFCGTMFVLVLRGGRFSLRMLLIGVTLLCILLATVLQIDRGYPEKMETRSMHER